MQLTTLLSELHHLPAAPAVVLKLVRTFDDDNARTADLVEIIEGDPVLVVQLLRLANSSAFFRGRLIENVADAVRMLGLSQLRALAIGVAARDSFPQVSDARLECFWRVSLMTAALARKLADNTPADEDATYLGALLSRIGELALRVMQPERMAELDQRLSPLAFERAREEVKVFAYSYVEVGAELLRRWQLPSRIVRIVERQRLTTLMVAQDREALLVQLAAWRVRVHEMEWSADEVAKAFPAKDARLLGINAQDFLAWEPDGDKAED
jgi:putative nucleotidyltransferase with HDIG domain